MTKLTLHFSRERSLFYFFMFYKSNQLSFRKWLNYKLKDSLFLKKNGNRTYIWHNNDEFKIIFKKIKTKTQSDKKFLDKLSATLDKEWKFLRPFITTGRQIKNIKEFKKYYNCVIRWWSAMSIIFYIPDLKGVKEDLKEKAIVLRQGGEKFSDKMDEVFFSYWQKNYPDFSRYKYVVTPEEAVLIDKHSLPLKKLREIKNRLKGFGLFNGKIFLEKDLMKELVRKKIKLEKEIKSNKIINLKGVGVLKISPVRGKVRLVIEKKDIGNLKNNEILVAEMTSPDFLPAIVKSKAIITNEGGMLCHAAIVARELKKPCVIGTKIATKVLHDGDLVEVDADKGVVKILKL